MKFNLSSIKSIKGMKNPIKVGKIGLQMRKHSPEMLMAAGAIGFVGTVILASKATLKAQRIIEEHREKLDVVDKVLEQTEDKESYNEKDANKDKVIVYTQTSVELGRIYAPSVVLGLATLGCFMGAYSIISRRNAALIAAYTIVEGAFSEYRQRVVSDLGDAWDHHFRYGGEMKEITEIIEDPETGKQKKVKRVVSELPKDLRSSMYARIFEPIIWGSGKNDWVGSSQFMNAHQYNVFFLTTSQDRMNDRLRADGYLFLNDVYDHLGFPRTEAGQIVGWVLGGGGDDRVIFCEALDMDSYKDGSPILLDFNVDGPILNKI
jgi:hypothetical protein